MKRRVSVLTRLRRDLKRANERVAQEAEWTKSYRTKSEQAAADLKVVGERAWNAERRLTELENRAPGDAITDAVAAVHRADLQTLRPFANGTPMWTSSPSSAREVAEQPTRARVAGRFLVVSRMLHDALDALERPSDGLDRCTVCRTPRQPELIR